MSACVTAPVFALTTLAFLATWSVSVAATAAPTKAASAKPTSAAVAPTAIRRGRTPNFFLKRVMSLPPDWSWFTVMDALGRGHLPEGGARAGEVTPARAATGLSGGRAYTA